MELDSLLNVPPHTFLRNAFGAILGREPDPTSLSFFREQLRTRRMSPVEVVGHLRDAREGRAHGVHIQGLRSRFLVARILRRIPGVGGAVVGRMFSVPELWDADTEGIEGWFGPTGVDGDADPLDRAAVAALGAPGFRVERPSTGAAAAGRELVLESGRRAVDHDQRAGTCFTTLCTVSYLPFARALVSSFHEHHPEIPVVLLVVDLDDMPDADVSDFDDRVTVVSGRELDIPRFDFLALKYSASDFCCALKSYLVAHVIETTSFARVVFMDADIFVFAPLTDLLEKLETSTFVVTPHTLRPLPYPDRFWEKPTLGDLFNAGTLNAGIFGLTVCDESVRFIDTWKEMVSGPGAFFVSGQWEQHAFNWITTWVDGVHILRNTAYNVAYWNLHDRSLRYRGRDDGDGSERWTVDGQPLVTFHFSGYSPEHPSVLSHHDRRHSLYILPSVARLFEFYRRRLEEHGADEEWDTEYAFSRFPSGIEITTQMRDLFKEYETALEATVSPWTPDGERYYCQALLSPMPQSGSLIPILFKDLYDQRLDLQSGLPGAHVEPMRLLPWIASHGASECGYDDLFNRHRPSSPTREGAGLLLSVQKRSPVVFDGVEDPLGDDRPELIASLRTAGLGHAAARLKEHQLEYYGISDISLLRQLLELRPDLRDRFPDPVYDDAGEFLEWLREEGLEHHLLPRSVAATFERTCKGRSLARIFSYVNDGWELAKIWPLAFVGVGSDDLARFLLVELRSGRQYDVEDVEMFRWTMIERPWTGVGLTLNLLPNLASEPSTLLPEGQERLLQPVLDAGPQFRRELRRYRSEHQPSPPVVEEIRNADRRNRRVTAKAANMPIRSRETTVFQVIDRLASEDGRLPLESTPSRDRHAIAALSDVTGRLSGANIFGYFKSPIGLGMMTRGLAHGLELHGVGVSRNPLGNVAMMRDLEMADFLGNYDFSFDTNIFVSYPHYHDLLLTRLPPVITEGRRNVVYLAWEQSDGSPYWPEVFGGFDQVWALSKFAAETFRRAMDRHVTAVPCAVDFEAFPEPASKTDFDLDEDRFTFLYVFDANSSIERKNPEAAIAAFASAFATDDRVTLVVKVSNAHRLENRRRLTKMVDFARGSGLDIRFVFEDMSRSRVLGLVSAVDCYLSLHRAEGFGYTCAEAMAYAKPVIATNYSGNLHFMNPMNSFLVDFEEVEVVTPEGPFQRGSVWAEPDVEQAAHFMRTVVGNPDAVRSVGERGKHDVHELLSYQAVGDIALKALTTPRTADR